MMLLELNQTGWLLVHVATQSTAWKCSKLNCIWFFCTRISICVYIKGAIELVLALSSFTVLCFTWDNKLTDILCNSYTWTIRQGEIPELLSCFAFSHWSCSNLLCNHQRVQLEACRHHCSRWNTFYKGTVSKSMSIAKYNTFITACGQTERPTCEGEYHIQYLPLLL